MEKEQAIKIFEEYLQKRRNHQIFIINDNDWEEAIEAGIRVMKCSIEKPWHEAYGERE